MDRKRQSVMARRITSTPHRRHTSIQAMTSLPGSSLPTASTLIDDHGFTDMRCR